MNEKLKKINFKKAIFFRDRGYFTVRLGERSYSIGERVRLEGLANLDNPIGLAEVEMVLVCRLRDIPSGVLDEEHDESCRSKIGLLNKMNTYYEEKVFLDSVVTCVKLRRIN